MHDNDPLPGGEQPHLSAHAAALAGTHAMAWGLFRIPEDELQVLGEVAGKDILEFGCGAARWSIALAQAGARPVGLDLSPRQLQHARRLLQEAGVDFPLIEASAEDVPLPDGSFDLANVIPGQYILVAIDHGWGINWGDQSTLRRYLMQGVPVELKSSAIVKQNVVAEAP